MKTEFEAVIENIDKAKIRERLALVGATLMKPEFMQKRVVFNLPTGHEIKGGWARVRDEGDKITTSIKIVDGDKIEDQKEVCLNIDNFDAAVEYLQLLGCERKAYQETLRELWIIDGVEITIDEWPFLEPFIEIESDSEMRVRTIVELLGYDYTKAFFGTVATLYSQKYGISEFRINCETPLITFEMMNPFL
jgi:adenylate cyclase, class 2